MKHKYTIEVETAEELKPYIHAVDLWCSIEEALQHIRTQLKHGDLSDETDAQLERVRDILMEGYFELR